MTMTSSEVQHELQPFEFTPGRKASWVVLRRLLPDIETALFFAKALNMDYQRLSTLISTLFKTSVVQALLTGGAEHSSTLQDYVVDVVPDAVWPGATRPTYSEDVPDQSGEFLPEVWDYIELEVAQSIAEVAESLSRALDSLPSIEGSMTFTHMAKLNKQRPTVGTYGAVIKHHHRPKNLVILDVSYSVSQQTVEAIAADVVALGFKSESHLAIVSDNTFVWAPGNYSVSDVLGTAEYSGTHYETLADLLQQNWGTVITIADYDSSASAGRYIADTCRGRIERVLDLSLVNRPTYLAEVVGQLATEVQPLLIASDNAYLTR